MLTLLLALTLSQTPALAPQPVLPWPNVCFVNKPSPPGVPVRTNEPVYICDSFWFDGLVPVTKTWFKAHCTKGPGTNNGEPIGVATCDAIAPVENIPAKEMARPRNVKPKLKAIGYGAATVGVLAVCVLACGGCGFMGGG
jgi:hypothetical protein